MKNSSITLGLAAILISICTGAQAQEGSDLPFPLTLQQAPLPISLPLATPASPIAEPIERFGSFSYEFSRPEKPGGRTIVLLHGSGGNEKTLMEIARRISPDATLLDVRGRVRQAGINRWYSRITSTSFDQSDVRSEAQAFSEFLKQTATQMKLDLDKAIFLGYSNGANLIAAMSMLHPGTVHRAVLLRAMPVLDEAPESKLNNAEFLTIAGRDDKTYGPFAPKLEEQIRKRGARVKSYLIDSGHNIGDEDARIVREWLVAASAEVPVGAGR